MREVVGAPPRALRRLDVLVNNAGVGIGAAADRARDQVRRPPTRRQRARDRPVLPRVRRAAAGGGAEHRNALVVNMASIAGKSPAAVAVGVLGDQGGGGRVHGGDEQGVRQARREVGRVRAGLRRHRHDRLREEQGPGRGDAPPERHSRGAALPAARLADVPGPGDHVPAPTAEEIVVGRGAAGRSVRTPGPDHGRGARNRRRHRQAAARPRRAARAGRDRARCCWRGPPPSAATRSPWCATCATASRWRPRSRRRSSTCTASTSSSPTPGWRRSCRWSDGDPEVFERTIDVNLIGAYYTLRAAGPHIAHARGYALAISSLAAALHPPLLGAYCASKAGVEALADSLRIELAPSGARVGVAYFAELDTDMVRAGFGTAGGQATERARSGGRGAWRPLEAGIDAIERGIARRSRRVVAPRVGRAAAAGADAGPARRRGWPPGRRSRACSRSRAPRTRR